MQTKVNDSKDAVKVSPAKRLSCHCSAQILYIETVNSCLHSVYICLQIITAIIIANCIKYSITEMWESVSLAISSNHVQNGFLRRQTYEKLFLGHLSKLDIILSIRSEINCVQMNSNSTVPDQYFTSF